MSVENIVWNMNNFDKLKKCTMFLVTVGTGKTFVACCIANGLARGI